MPPTCMQPPFICKVPSICSMQGAFSSALLHCSMSRMCACKCWGSEVMCLVVASQMRLGTDRAPASRTIAASKLPGARNSPAPFTQAMEQLPGLWVGQGLAPREQGIQRQGALQVPVVFCAWFSGQRHHLQLPVLQTHSAAFLRQA